MSVTVYLGDIVTPIFFPTPPPSSGPVLDPAPLTAVWSLLGPILPVGGVSWYIPDQQVMAHWILQALLYNPATYTGMRQAPDRVRGPAHWYDVRPQRTIVYPLVRLSTATISWTAPISGGDPVQYNVKFGHASGVYTLTYVVAAPATSVALVTANPTPGEWWSAVTAENAGGESAPSNEVHYITI